MRPHLLAVRDRLLERAEELVEVICAETGKQRAEAVTTELMAVCETIDWYAKHGERLLRPAGGRPGTMAHKKAWIRYEPLGVVGVISPWNYPFTLSMTPLVTALFGGQRGGAQAVRGDPDGGAGHRRAVRARPAGATSSRWSPAAGPPARRSSAAVSTRSSSPARCGTGKRVMAAAADTLTPVLLELGGKDPMIVCADADLDRAARGAVWGAFQNSGQTCMSVERVYVDRAVADAFIDRVIDRDRCASARTTARAAVTSAR